MRGDIAKFRFFTRCVSVGNDFRKLYRSGYFGKLRGHVLVGSQRKRLARRVEEPDCRRVKSESILDGTHQGLQPFFQAERVLRSVAEGVENRGRGPAAGSVPYARVPRRPGAATPQHCAAGPRPPAPPRGRNAEPAACRPAPSRRQSRQVKPQVGQSVGHDRVPMTTRRLSAAQRRRQTARVFSTVGASSTRFLDANATVQPVRPDLTNAPRYKPPPQGNAPHKCPRRGH